MTTPADVNTRVEVAIQTRGNGAKRRNVIIATSQPQTGVGELNAKESSDDDERKVRDRKWEGRKGRLDDKYTYHLRV